MTWKQSLTKVAKDIRNGNSDITKDESIRILEYYESQYYMNEENLTISASDKYSKYLNVLREYVYTLNPDYREKKMNESHNRNMNSDDDTVIHLNW